MSPVNVNLTVTVRRRWWVTPAMWLVWGAACFGWYGPADRWMDAVYRRGFTVVIR